MVAVAVAWDGSAATKPDSVVARMVDLVKLAIEL